MRFLDLRSLDAVPETSNRSVSTNQFAFELAAVLEGDVPRR
jgi:hypothetical protein